MVDSQKFYGVYIPKEAKSCDRSNENEKTHVYPCYEQAAVILKEYKNARFKKFTSENDARYFALHGSEGGPGNPNVISESIPFKSLKRQDIYKFRLCLEKDNYTSVKRMIWENPRYLISIGDTPTIMQEGPRYNALHIIAHHNRAQLAELILSTVSCTQYSKLLYGAGGENSYIVRPELLVDLYLNTPDKSLNETPLHFAAKYGAVDVIAVFVQYSQLNIDVKNKFNQTPKDIACSKVPSDSSKLAKKIQKMLDDLYYVPIWRCCDDAVQPVIGKPYSPKSPPVCPMVTSPVSPSMEIKAVAGPMSYSEATDFHKTWKSPGRSANCTSPSTPHLSQGLLLRNPLEMERGLEKVGRTLATKFHVSWKEYWPFLDKFIDLRSEEGLKMLEEYLLRKSCEISILRELSYLEPENQSVLTPISELCNVFAKCSIKSPQESDLADILAKEKGAGDAANAPFLLIENICVAFADSILETFAKHFTADMTIEDNVAACIKKVRNLIATLNNCRRESIFRNFPFAKVHPRIASWLTRKLFKFDERRLAYAMSTFQLVDLTETNSMVKQISLSPSSINVELEQIVQTVKCINDHIIKFLASVVIPLESPKTETDCRKEWTDVVACQCSNSDSILSKLRRLGQEVGKKIMFPDDDDIVKNGVNQKASVTRNSVTSCDNEPKVPTQKICDNENNSDSDDDEAFFTPPSSLSGSDDEMDSPEEGPEIFILDAKGTSMDNAVLEAIADVIIDRDKYPNIYRWKHSVLLHSAMDRFSWPSPESNTKKRNTLCNGK